MKKIVLAISIETPAMPPKPRTPAINAMTKKVTTQLNMIQTSVSVSARPIAPCLEKQSSPELLVPDRETGKFAERSGTKSAIAPYPAGLAEATG